MATNISRHWTGQDECQKKRLFDISHLILWKSHQIYLQTSMSKNNHGYSTVGKLWATLPCPILWQYTGCFIMIDIKYLLTARSLVQFPSSCKIWDQTDKMPKNESKNQIKTVYQDNFPLKIQYFFILETPEYRRQKTVVWHFKSLVSKCTCLRKNLPHASAH